MTHLPIPIEVLYAGLAGTLLATLIVATIPEPVVGRESSSSLPCGWLSAGTSCLKGLHKVDSYYAGPVDVDGKIHGLFSEPYFKVAPGPIGERMRKEFYDPAAVIESRVKRTQADSQLGVRRTHRRGAGEGVPGAGRDAT